MPPYVTLINRSKNTELARRALVASTALARMKGLLGRRSLASGEGLVILRCNSIHTFFMRFPIDAVFVDGAHRVVKLLTNLPAFRISGIYFSARLCIELPAGTIAKTATAPGDEVHFQEYPAGGA